jgi:hypothetical protein
MKSHRIASPEITPDFNAALKRAAAVVDEQLGDNMPPGDFAPPQ